MKEQRIGVYETKLTKPGESQQQELTKPERTGQPVDDLEQILDLLRGACEKSQKINDKLGAISSKLSTKNIALAEINSGIPPVALPRRRYEVDPFPVGPDPDRDASLQYRSQYRRVPYWKR